jgi:hypothetical protein
MGDKIIHDREVIERHHHHYHDRVQYLPPPSPPREDPLYYSHGWQAGCSILFGLFLLGGAVGLIGGVSGSPAVAGWCILIDAVLFVIGCLWLYVGTKDT